jgi:methyl-accepting chemotaxis protein
MEEDVMKVINNLKIGTKILAGYIVILLVMAVVGAVALINLGRLQGIVVDLTSNLEVDRQLTDSISQQILRARLYAVSYIKDEDQADLDSYGARFIELEKLISQADIQITKPERIAMLSSIKEGTAKYNSAFGQIVQVIQTRSSLINNVLDIQGPLAEKNLDQIQESAHEAKDSELLYLVSEGQRVFLLMRLNAFKYLEHGDTQWLDTYNQSAKDTTAALDALNLAALTSTQRRQLKDAQIAISAYQDGFKKIQSDYTLQNSLYSDVLDVTGPALREKADEISASVGKDFDTRVSETNNMVVTTRTILEIGISAAILVSLLFGLFISRAISKPIKEMSRLANSIAGGELDHKIQFNDESEVGALAESFRLMIAYLREMAAYAGEIANGNLAVDIRPRSEYDKLGHAFSQMVGNLRGVVEQLSASANSLASATAQIMGAVTEQAASTRQQASAVAETTTTIEEARQTAEQAADRAKMVSEMSRESTQLAEQGQEAVKETVDSMENIRNQVGTIAETILLLSEQTQQIGEIISTVNDIADQSNLLAVNAAIEAARAGDAGRGFAVVANEVGNLAKQSQQATAQVRDILGEIQKASNKAVMVTEEGTKRAEIGTKTVERTGKSLQAIALNFRDVAQSAQQIAASSNEQLVGMDQITAAMLNINQATRQSDAGMQMVSQASKNLSDMATNINGIIEQYRLR